MLAFLRLDLSELEEDSRGGENVGELSSGAWGRSAHPPRVSLTSLELSLIETSWELKEGILVGGRRLATSLTGGSGGRMYKTCSSSVMTPLK